MHQEYTIPAQDFSVAGVASSNFKQLLKQLNLPPKVIKRIIVAVFEAEINVIAHSYGGKIICELSEDTITVEIIDTGPGIPNLDLAMKEGWSTATEEIQEMGYGAGMGLPNIKKSCDRLSIKTKAGDHTHITLGFDLKEEP